MQFKGMVMGALAIAPNDGSPGGHLAEDDNGKVSEVTIRRLDDQLQEIRTYQRHKDQVSSLAFAPNG